MAKKKKEVKKPTPPPDKDTPLKVNTSFENLLGMMANTSRKKKSK
jgi:hypothetical protein